MALAGVAPRSALTGADLEALRALAPCLGASHRDDQLRHLDLLCRRLAAAEAEARQAEARNARLLQTLGWLTGCLLAILAL